MNKKLFINRELSWLEFNQRVINEAADPAVPLLEQINFMAIASANLDEFFMVRVGGLKLIIDAGITNTDPSGMRPQTQLDAIRKRTNRMNRDIASLYHQNILPGMASAGIHILNPADLSPLQINELECTFLSQIYPAITPTAVRPDHPFPLLSNLSLYVLIKLSPEPRKRIPRFAFLPIPPALPRFIALPVPDAHPSFLQIEDVVSFFASRFFPGQSLIETATVRATRNADIHVDESFSVDLAHAMRKVLRQRKTSGCVRMEIAGNPSEELTDWLTEAVGLQAGELVHSRAPLMLNSWRAFCQRPGYEHLRYPPWIPQQNPLLDPSRPMFELISKGDVLLSLPYERFDPVIRFLEEAAQDPETLAIKMVLYRTDSESPIIEALRKAAQAGKAVTVLVELKARFDEERNIEWADRLERDGVQVIHGIKDHKTHAKICMVVRREQEGVVRYLHLGTGNYNATTARLYTDIGLFSRQEDLGMDASAFFNTVCGYSEPLPHLKLAQAPIDLKERLLELINAESAYAAKGAKARIVAKMNALVDPDIIEALYRASKAGVSIDLIVRGICCLSPGVPGLSQNIRVISIIDRFLEHSRIFMFHHGGSRQVFISSADWMPRNLQRRIELLIPVEDFKCRNKCVAILKAALNDACKGWWMQPDGSYLRSPRQRRNSRSQEILFNEACRTVDQLRRSRRTKFEPHMPNKSPSGNQG